MRVEVGLGHLDVDSNLGGGSYIDIGETVAALDGLELLGNGSSHVSGEGLIGALDGSEGATKARQVVGVHGRDRISTSAFAGKGVHGLGQGIRLKLSVASGEGSGDRVGGGGHEGGLYGGGEGGLLLYDGVELVDNLAKTADEWLIKDGQTSMQAIGEVLGVHV